jgi:hypothetical protein
MTGTLAALQKRRNRGVFEISAPLHHWAPRAPALVALLTLRKDQPAWDPSSLECGPVPIAGSAERLARETEFYHTIER